MIESRKTYEGKDVAFIIPTKDRPQKLKDLLNSLANQTVICGRVIVVDGGKSVRDVVVDFENVLSIKYQECHPPGQIRQRNAGIELLDDKALLVGFIDDDILMEPDALEKMLHFWNRIEPDTAGVGFNITNAHASSVLSRILPGRCRPGRILPSGINTSFQNISSDLRTQWLGGGYTVWRREILNKFVQENLNTRWAIGEDVRFSYPIGKKYPLYICVEARVRHEHVYDQAVKSAVHIYQGRKQALALFYFVRLHTELSSSKCLLSMSMSVIAKIIVGLLTLNPQMIKFSLGMADGVFICIKSLFKFVDLRSELED